MVQIGVMSKDSFTNNTPTYNMHCNGIVDLIKIAAVSRIHGEKLRYYTQPGTDFHGRFGYEGNLALGHFWFSLFNVTRSDCKYVFMICSREKDLTSKFINATAVIELLEGMLIIRVSITLS
jgi:hypothetical protein